MTNGRFEVDFRMESYPMSDWVRVVLAILVTATTMFLFGTGKPVPAELLTINTMVLTFYFVQVANERATASAQAQTESAVKAALTEPPKT